MPALLLLVPLPAFAQEQIMLEEASDQGTFTVQIDWTTADIGVENALEIHFIEPETGKEVEDMIYEFSIMQDDTMLFIRPDQTSNVQEVTFSEPGSYTILVNNIDGLGENAIFPVQVIPEFPLVWALPGAFVVLFVLRNRLAG